MSEPRPGSVRVVTVEDTCPDCNGITLVIPIAGICEPTHDDTCPTKQPPANLAAILNAIDTDPRTRQTPPPDEDQDQSDESNSSEEEQK